MSKNKCPNCESNLQKTIVKLRKENKRLRSENKTLVNALQTTESYILAISENKTIKQIFNELDTKTFTRKVKMTCSKCDNGTMNKRKFDNYSLVYCSRCGFRNRIDDTGNG